MRILRSSDEIRQQIKQLRNLTPVDGPHKRKVQMAIDEAIEELSVGVDDTTEEFENQEDIVKDSVLEARDWKEGGSNAPSESFGKLVERTPLKEE